VGVSEVGSRMEPSLSRKEGRQPLTLPAASSGTRRTQYLRVFVLVHLFAGFFYRFFRAGEEPVDSDAGVRRAARFSNVSTLDEGHR